MSGSLSIILVLISVGLTLLATRTEARISAPRTDRPADLAQTASEQTLRKPAKRLLSRANSLQRLRTDRTDIQRSIGHDYGAPDPGERIWPPNQ